MTWSAVNDAITLVLQKERLLQLMTQSGSGLQPNADKTSDNTHLSSGFASSLLHFAFRREKRSRKDESASNAGLSNIAVEELEKVLQPIVRQIEELDAESLLHLTRVSSGGAQLGDGIQVRPIHDEIDPPPSQSMNDSNDFSHNASLEDLPVVRYLHLHEVPDQYSVGIFVFPPHGKIPLHDHPGMCVLSRVLYGDLQRRSLDLPPSNDDDAFAGQKRRAYYRTTPPPHRPMYIDRESSSYSSTDTSSTAPRSQIPVDHLVAPQCTVLYPREGNLHEFVAGPYGAAVLDVLLPPYDADHHRDCTFYEIECSSDMNDSMSTVDAATVGQDVASQTNLVPCWIIPTGRPENFHCISGQYRDLGEP